MKDIHNVLQSLDKIMNDLQSGRLDQGMTEAEKLGNLGSLSSIDATLQVEQSLSVESAVMSETPTAPDKPANSSVAIEKPVDLATLDVAQSKMVQFLSYFPFSSSNAFSTTRSAVRPNFSYKILSGAEAPK